MASTYLSRATGSSSTTETQATLSLWVKRSELTTTGNCFFGHYVSNSLRSAIYFNSNDDKIKYFSAPSDPFLTNRVFRDTNAWYHIVIAWDLTQATASDRIKLYVNGVQETSFSSTSYPTQNQTDFIPNFGTQTVGANIYNSSPDLYYDGSMTHVHFIDGTAYDASAFGETDATTGIWKPKTAPSVTYGTNGFFLKFENSGSMGTDSSGNGNNFTVNGTMTQTVDTPSNVFATLNPLDNYYCNGTFSNGNNTLTTPVTEYAYVRSTLGASSGKYYAECKITTASATDHSNGVAFAPATSITHSVGVNDQSYGYKGSGQVAKNNSNLGGTYASLSAGDIIGIGLDLDNNKLYFAKNGTWQNSGDPTSGATGTGAVSITPPSSTTDGVYYFASSDNANLAGGTYKFDWNFGNGYFGTTAVSSAQNPDDGIGIFEYDVPTGYRALCTKSINAQEYS